MKRLIFIKNCCLNWGIYFLIALFTSIYTAAAIIRHSYFESFAFDLGIFDQSIWLYSRLKIPYSTIKEMIVLGDHFSPSLAILAPFYWLFNDVRILLFLQAFITCFGALPIFLISKKYLKNNFISLIFSFAYLTYFGLQNALLFDFHEITIITGLIPWLFYLLIRKKWVLYFFLTLIFLGLKEDASIITGSIGLFLIFKFKNYRVGLLTIILSIVSFFLVTKVLIPTLNPAGFHYQPQIPLTVKEWWLTFTYPPIKIRTLLISFLPLAYLPIFSFSGSIPIIFHFLEHFPGKDLIGRWDIYLHYRAPLASLMAIAAILGTKNINERLLTSKQKTKINNLLGSVILTCVIVTQYFFHLPLNSLFKKAFYAKRTFVSDINYLISKIPKEASVATQNNIAPHLTHREEIYLFPNIQNPKRLKPEYILLDLRENQPPNNFFTGVHYGRDYIKNEVNILMKTKEYKIIDQKNQAVLLKKS